MRKYAKQYYNNVQNVESYYNYLVEIANGHKYVGIVNEWILDNYYRIVEQDKVIKEFLSSKKRYNAAFIDINIYDILKKKIRKCNYNMSEASIIKFLNNYQDNYNVYFSYETVRNIKTVILIILIEQISEICDIEFDKLEDVKQAEESLEKIDKDEKNKDKLSIKEFIEEDSVYLNHPIYLEKLYSGLKELGKDSNDIYNELLIILSRDNINLDQTFEEVYENIARESILIGNIFGMINITGSIKIETLISRLSHTEKMLETDEYYEKMTIESKELYRKRILKNAKREHISENEYVKRLIIKSHKENRHIGFYILKEKNYSRRMKIYLMYITMTTLLISLFLGHYLFKPFWISFILFIIPVSEIVIQLTNWVLLRFIKPLPLPKLDYSTGVPVESSSMITITTIVKNKEKVADMFKKLEIYYLANKSDNLYFTLLGDCASYSEIDAPFDKEVIDTGLKLSNELNQKYGKNIFHFLYRKRMYNPKESTYLGYERKRGALEQLNQLLLGKLTEEEKSSYFHVYTVDSIKNRIKYVIPLDTDTELVLETAFKLIGAMAHPLNKPIIDEKRNIVVNGYGMMQPKVNVDVESTNESVYTQVYAGIGGFDVYNSVIPCFYQDVFNEGSFVGKGIYDLEVFDKVLTKRFPENLVLSHDLLEGNYIRCGFLSDVELIDDFPSSFLVDSTRRHRWARGDTQLLRWLKPSSPLSLLHKFKIFDNLRRNILDLSLLTLLFLAFLVSRINPYIWILFIIFIIALPIVFFIIERLKIQKERSTKTKQYLNIIVGFKATFIRIVSSFSSIPYNAKLYVSASLKALYRMFISKKNLLNWITAEEASKTIKGDITSYIINFQFNYYISVLLILLTVAVQGKYAFFVSIIALLFCLSPIIFFWMGCLIDNEVPRLNKKADKEMYDLAFNTWKYFKDFLTDETNYLIPDNYQLNRSYKRDYKTSSTNIGFSLLAVISAKELGFIKTREAVNLITKILKAISELPKWNGHLYNWYNIETKKIIYPYSISSVDSGNFVASLIIVKDFLNKHKEELLAIDVDKIINDTDFSKLYNNVNNVFACCYNTQDEQLTPYSYDKFASEARLTSFIAIAKGDIPYKHWFNLDKTLTKHHLYKGLVSWSGTSFEYFMPFIFMKNYPNTLIDESYYFSFFCQKEYMSEIDFRLPWGISESAYNELDDSKNYKYQAFGTPYLKLRDNVQERIVIAPYASMMALPKFPRDVYQNYLKMKRLKLLGEYGLYESYEVEDKTPIYAYFAHHQGMILTSLTNYLKDNILKDYFYGDIRIQAIDILNKEKIQLKPMINFKINRYKKYDYDREILVNDVRTYDGIKENPEISVLSNSKYTVMLNDRGNGFSRYNAIQLNRYRKISEQDNGIYVYLRDLKNNNVWSNTYAPTYKKPLRYEVTFATDEIKYARGDKDITTLTEVTVVKGFNAEIRKITLRNISKETKNIEITSYMEPIISSNSDDISHRVFNNMFIKSSYDKDANAIIVERKKRMTNESYFMINKLFVENPTNEYSYETERENFLSRNDEMSNPSGLYHKLTNYVGDNLDPIISIRNSVKLYPNGKTTFYLINGFGTSKEQVLEIARTYSNRHTIVDAYKIATIMICKNIKRLGVETGDINLFNKALNYLYQTTKVHLSSDRRKYLLKNELSQPNLWRFAISGDRPIILVEHDSASSLGLAKEIIKMFEYYKTRGMFVDVVIINSDNEIYKTTIKKAISNELHSIYAMSDIKDTPGSVTLIERDEITDDELNLLRSIARLKFDSKKNSSLKEYIELLQIDNRECSNKASNMNSEPVTFDNLDYDNEYGGFASDGKEYVINNPNTPKPWSNVLCNENIGTVITNNNNGFTYALNSREFKVTSWTNDALLNDQSEGFMIDNHLINWYSCKHGLGYSTLYFKDRNYKIDATYFIPKDVNAKVCILNITGNSDKTIDLNYWINPVLGVTEEKTARHIVETLDEKNNVLFLENRYISVYKDMHIYMTSSEKISKVINGTVLRGFDVTVSLEANNPKKLIFVLGYINNPDDINKELGKLDYEKLYQETVDYWQDLMGKVSVSSKEKSFDYLINSWLPYQTFASRIMAKTGFYQVGGAFGFRDQLQDCLNICSIASEFTRKQIINCAKHQFVEGDVLHWWHEKNKFGLRSRFKDDYLWLVYATEEYIRITDDKDILNEKICYVNGDYLNENEEERGMEFTYTEKEDTLFNHLTLCINKITNELGENGLPLMGGGDWNDGMNHIGIKGIGTSVWLAFFANIVVKRYINILKIMKMDSLIKPCEEFNKKLSEDIQKNAWDGKYFIRAFNDKGKKIGSSESVECKIDLISQSFAILSEIATKEQITSIVSEVDRQLVDQNGGFIKLLTPAFTDNWIDPGYIKNYPKGIRENAGQYTHACAWYIMALVKIGMYDKAFEYYQMINPINHARDKEGVLRYKVEPYVIAADIYSNKHFYAEGGWTWYTGSSGWFYKVAFETILGLQREGNILHINPHLPKEMYGTKVTYHYLDTVYNITLENNGSKEIELVNDKKKHDFIVRSNDD